MEVVSLKLYRGNNLAAAKGGGVGGTRNHSAFSAFRNSTLGQSNISAKLRRRRQG